MARPASFPSSLGKNERILVLVQLNGGNDGLNTVIPLDQYSNLFRVRQNIIIPEKRILPVADTIGFHPSMTGLKRVYDEGKLGIIQDVGYPNQNRSHFRSMEIWSSASPAEQRWTTGWAGRHLDIEYPGFPDDYPDRENPDPFAVSMGFSPSETCQGAAANFSIALRDPFSLRPLAQGEEDGDYGPYYRDELDFVRTSIEQTNQYSEQILVAAERGRNVMEYPDSRLARDLKNVALMISGGLRTKIYVVSLGGFDTHSGQVEAGASLTGTHSQLLQTLSDAINVFQQDLRELGLEERVLGMTFSEFGRQIRSNDSYGTDHGTAAPLLLFGACVHANILGNNPVIDPNVDRQAGVPMQYDFRDVYGSVLKDWFEVPEDQIRQFIRQDFTPLPLISGCGVTSTGAVEDKESNLKLATAPNPYREYTDITFSTKSKNVHLSVFDNTGRHVQTLIEERRLQGEHQIRFQAGHLPPGPYYIRLVTDRAQKTLRTLKVL